MTEVQTARDTCPVCGAKKTRPDSTICAYCATPFDLVGGEAAADEEHPALARIRRIPEHADYAGAMEWTPLEGEDHRAAAARRRRGIGLVVLGLALGLAANTLASGSVWVLAAGGALSGWGAVLVVGAVRCARRILTRPLLRRPAVVLDRRSETAMRGWSGKTVYFFTLLFADGAEGEFRWPGRGIDHEPLVNGVTGVAYTRGGELLGFRQIRV